MTRVAWFWIPFMPVLIICGTFDEFKILIFILIFSHWSDNIYLILDMT